MPERIAADTGPGPNLPAAFWEMGFNNRDIATFLREVIVEFAEDIGSPVRGISWAITLLRSGDAITMAAGSAPARAADAVQCSFEDGPARSAVRSGEFVLVSDTSLERRWPGYASAAAGLGIRSLLSVPFVPRDLFRTAANLYAPWPHVFTSDDITAAVRFARQISRALRVAQQMAGRAEGGADLSSAQLSRALAGLALRTLTREYGFSNEAALEYLRSVAGNRLQGPEDGILPGPVSGAVLDFYGNSPVSTNVRAASSAEAPPARPVL
jgi:GAF domain-containing protein